MDLMCFNPVGGCTLGTLVAPEPGYRYGRLSGGIRPQTLELLEDYLPATTFDGQIMGVTNLRQLNESFWLTMNADVLEELGLTEKAEACDDWTTYAEIMQEVVDNTDLVSIGPNDGNGSIVENYAFFVGEEEWSDSFAFDNLGDQYSLIYVDSETDTVMNYYATEEYAYAVEMAHEWYEEAWSIRTPPLPSRPRTPRSPATCPSASPARAAPPPRSTRSPAPSTMCSVGAGHSGHLQQQPD